MNTDKDSYRIVCIILIIIGINASGYVLYKSHKGAQVLWV